MLRMAVTRLCPAQVQLQFKKICNNCSNAVTMAWKNNCLSNILAEICFQQQFQNNSSGSPVAQESVKIQIRFWRLRVCDLNNQLSESRPEKN